MKKLIFLILSFIVFGCMLPNDPIEFYVDVNGDDSNQGTFEAPFKTIVQAKNAIRSLSEQQRQKNINVYLRGGTLRCQKLLFLNLKTQVQTRPKLPIKHIKTKLR